MPILEETLPTLAKIRIFSVLNAKDGFRPVKLDEASSHLTTFYIPFEQQRYLRTPFGISMAPKEFQRWMHVVS